jgi:hypothetical protein
MLFLAQTEHRSTSCAQMNGTSWWQVTMGNSIHVQNKNVLFKADFNLRLGTRAKNHLIKACCQGHLKEVKAGTREIALN